MPEPNPTPPPDDLPILVGPADVDQLLETAEALADEIAAAVGLAGSRSQKTETIAPPAPAPVSTTPVEGHTIIEEAPQAPVERERAEKIPDPAPIEPIAPAEAIAAQPVTPLPEVDSPPPSPADVPQPVESPIAADSPPQAIAESIEPQPEQVAVEPPTPAVQPEAAPPVPSAEDVVAGDAPPKASIIRRILQRFMRGVRAVALAPILALAALAWLIDRPFAKTSARAKNYVGAIALATAITAALSFILPDLLKDDPFAGESASSESAPP
ncbi:Immunoglobulin A1 protease autotransporter precursor [Phycisphaerae bacterium RAS2]|nr:Immunoglobulin A1 protease autotransporter precursor [Phycisphaerae bacterium RAS2]